MPQTNTQPIDQTALNLSRSIRDAEGGDYSNTSGDAGTSAGAYQWNNGKVPLQPGQIPANFKSSAQSLGLDPNDFSQTNQDHVAYEEIKKDLDSGLSQSQVAAKWNSGLTTGWENHVGDVVINGKTVHYDTPAYVNKVKESYLKYSQQGASPASSLTPPTALGQAQTQQPSQSTFGGALQPPTPPQSTTQAPSTDTNAPESVTGDIAQGNYGGAALTAGKGILNAIVGAPANLGTHLAELTGSATDALGLTTGERAKLDNKLVASGNKNFLGGNDPTLQNGVAGAKQIAGDALQTGVTAASGFVAPASFLGMLGTGAALGAAQGAGNALSQNSSTGDIAKQGLIGSAVGGVTGGIGYGLGGLLNKLGIKSATLAVRPSASDFADGYDSKFAVDNGLTGNAQQVANKAKTYMTNLTSQLKAKLGKSNAGIDLASVFDKTKAELTSQKGLESNFLQNGNLQGALQKLENEVLAVNPSGELPLLGAQTIKQQTGMYGEWLNGAPDPDANAMSTVANTFYRNIKSEIESKFPKGEISDINAQLQKAIPIMRAAIRRIPVNARSSALSLTDMLGALGFSANPATLALPAFQHAMNSGLMSKIAPTTAKVISKATPFASALAPRGINGLLGN